MPPQGVQDLFSCSLVPPSGLASVSLSGSLHFSLTQPLFIPQTRHVLSHVLTSVRAVPYFWNDLLPFPIHQTPIQSLKSGSDIPFCWMPSSLPQEVRCVLPWGPMPLCPWLCCGTGHVALRPSVGVRVTRHAEGPPSHSPPARVIFNT